MSWKINSIHIGVDIQQFQNQNGGLDRSWMSYYVPHEIIDVSTNPFHKLGYSIAPVLSNRDLL